MSLISHWLEKGADFLNGIAQLMFRRKTNHYFSLNETQG